MKDRLLKAIQRLRALGPDRPLIVLGGIFIVLLLAQGVRYGCTGRLEKSVIQSLEQATEGPPKRVDIKDVKEYDAIMEQGILGPKPRSKPSTQKLWGIMGDSVLFGSSAQSAKPYRLGAMLPNGEKIARIGCTDVVLEKDGTERTVCVFTELKQQPQPAGKSPSAPSPPSTPKSAPKPSPAGTESSVPPHADEESAGPSEAEVPAAIEIGPDSGVEVIIKRRKMEAREQ